MSRASFPRLEHIALLHQAIAQKLLSYRVPLELTERGVDHYRCCYRFALREPHDSRWAELSIHFQVAERLEGSQDTVELEQILARFVERHFSRAGVKPPRP